MFGLGLQELMALGMLVAIVVPFWKIFSKAGFPGALGITQIIPFVNLIVLFYVAFSEWPVHRQLDQVRQRSRPEAT